MRNFSTEKLIAKTSEAATSSHDPRVSSETADDQWKVMGLHVGGIIIERTRRMVPLDNPTTEIITYTLEGKDHRKYYVDDYAPAHYFERGSYIDVPVYVKPYRKRNNDLSYTLCIVRSRMPTHGESF